MTTQVKPTSGGPFTTITQSSQHVTLKTSTWGKTLTSGELTHALRATNEWLNCAGNGTAAVRAQATMAAIGLVLQEI